MIRRCTMVVLAFAASLALVAGLSRPQDEKKSAESKSGEEVVKGRLPNYFAKIGLSSKEQERVRDAAQPFEAKIATLRKQIADLKKQIGQLECDKLVACEKLLRDYQKTALKGRRDEAEKEKAAKKQKTANGDRTKSEAKKP